ncbi:MAG: segregation and condensation protein A [Elusimicrobiota bacterium]
MDNLTDSNISENDLTKSGWKVNLETFEGPLDLLLHLIKKKNLDIYDIQIARITSEYIRYIEILKTLDLENIGDFLVVASILMRIKSKTLLPTTEPESEDEEDAEELRQNLIARLIEYKKFKKSSEYFRKKELENKDIFPLSQYPVKEFGHSVEATLFDLIDAFQNLIENAAEDVKDIITEEISVEDKVRYILDKIELKSEASLSDLIEDKSSLVDIIATLLAILELVRTHQIKIIQRKKFGNIKILKNEQKE